MNDTPEIAAITAATYNDTAADDTFANVTGTLSGSDRDNDTLTYSATGQVSDLSQAGFDKSVSNAFGTLYLNSTSGAYKFVPNDAAIEALQAAASTSFSFTANDGTANSAAQTLTINLNGVNDEPVVDLNGSGTSGTGVTLNYTAGSAAAVIAPAGIVTDRDSVDFNGGLLEVSFPGGGTAADQLTIFNQGTGAGQIGISGSNVTYGNVVIGTFTGGQNGTQLFVTLNANATQAAVTALVEDIRYSNATSGNATKTVNFLLMDGDGTANGGDDIGTATATINVTASDTAAPTDIVFNLAVGTGNFSGNGINTGMTLGSFTAKDIDSTTWTFTIGSVSGQTLPAIQFSPGNSGSSVNLVTSAAIDPGKYQFTVTATDPAGHSFTETYTLSVGTTGGDASTIFTISNGTDISFGLNGGDTINGGSGDDALVGGQANDLITGGGGADQLIGGQGNDTFIYTDITDSTSANRDVIFDFEEAGTGDLISLSAIDANTTLAGDQAFAFGGQTTAVVNNGVTWFQDVANNVTIIQADNNGDGVADLVITLSGLHTLTNTGGGPDFIL